ncbi:MAG: hypothetical protein WKG07_00950 [Hymenobacter sp.]
MCALLTAGGYAEYAAVDARPLPAGARRLVADRGRQPARNHLHRLVQRVPDGRPPARRNGAGARRQQRHRPHPHSASQRRRVARCWPPPVPPPSAAPASNSARPAA